MTTPIDLATVRAAVADAVADIPGLIAAGVFGSIARGEAGPLSDIDVAVLLHDTPDACAACDRIADRLIRRLKTDRVDLVRLDRARLPLRYRVLRDMVLVIARDDAALERFAAESVRLYLDFKPLRDRALQAAGDLSLGGV